MSFRLTKETILQFLLMGLFSMLAGVYLANSFNPNWSAVLVLLEPMGQSWWRLAVVFFSFGFLSIFLARKGRNALAEIVGTFAFMVLLYPTFALVALLPEGLGYEALLIVMGLLITQISLSALMAILLLNNPGLVNHPAIMSTGE
jgi:hypothetical protein